MARYKEKLERLSYECELEYRGIHAMDAAQIVAEAVDGHVEEIHDRKHQEVIKHWVVVEADENVWLVRMKSTPYSVTAMITTPCLKVARTPILQAIIRALDERGEQIAFRPRVNSHILSMPDIQNVVRLWYKKEEEHLKTLGVSPHKIEYFIHMSDHSPVKEICKMKTPTSFGLFKAWFGPYYTCPKCYDEYNRRSLNLAPIWMETLFDQGIEFRCFESPVQADEIPSRLSYLLTFVAKAAR